jgi:hypothetical protein
MEDTKHSSELIENKPRKMSHRWVLEGHVTYFIDNEHYTLDDYDGAEPIPCQGR